MNATTSPAKDTRASFAVAQTTAFATAASANAKKVGPDRIAHARSPRRVATHLGETDRYARDMASANVVPASATARKMEAGTAGSTATSVL